ncbi:MAG: putative secreted protein [Saliniramus fredricksonii]|uniref:Putative secreted protein n=1 Tax=Saliniramus fredricksonii TaxID=1653334 RepID=A0A0P7ZZW2_9HYPH|nr:TIGR02301 family protein [Saliniramus fredricksonii]KPQ10600.1 MAG: putative secreted protein [Saliniramus fredricksonii]SCC79289.1 TIGR02301 family protein [Saliniramus fredricksonii]
MKHAILILLLAAAFMLTGPVSGSAQDGAPSRPPSYEADLMRLAEVMGSLAFLRDLCAAQDASEWPERMQDLLEAEGPERAERLAGAYNRGYAAFALTYRRCTPAAEIAIARFLEEGDALAGMIATRYGN